MTTAPEGPARRRFLCDRSAARWAEESAIRSTSVRWRSFDGLVQLKERPADLTDAERSQAGGAPGRGDRRAWFSTHSLGNRGSDPKPVRR